MRKIINPWRNHAEYNCFGCCPGVIVLLCCIPFYVLSFAQMLLLPISAAAKGVLWTILFGLAKTCQYGGLTILGVEGYVRLKNWLKRKKT